MKETTNSVKRRVLETLIGARYSLIPFKEDHITDRYIGWLNDPEVNRFTEVRHTHQTYQTVLEFVRSFYNDTEKYMWGIYPNDTNEPIGTATLHTVDRHHGSGELGLLIGEKDYWGKGASIETFELIAQFAFETLGLRRIGGGTYASNYGINFTMKMLGFTHEGTMRQGLAVSPGKYIDKYYWGLLGDEWKVRKKPRS